MFRLESIFFPNSTNLCVARARARRVSFRFEKYPLIVGKIEVSGLCLVFFVLLIIFGVFFPHFCFARFANECDQQHQFDVSV